MAGQKTILITGCSSGIGFALIEPLLQRGHRVFASLRNLEGRSSLFDPLRSQYPTSLTVLELDVTKAEDREAAIAEVLQHAGGLDVLVNNAGYGVFGPLEEASESAVREQFEGNFFGPLFLTQAALPLLRKSRGRVITLSSILGEVAMPFTSLYCASKFALEGLFEAVRHETAAQGVDASLVLPGGHKTRFFHNRQSLLRSGSPYSAEAERVLKLMGSEAANGRGSAESVVRKLLPLIEEPAPPLRTYVGLDAKFIHCLHSLLPQFIFQPLLRTGIKLVSRMRP